MKKSPRKKKCICNTVAILKQITGQPKPLDDTELNKIRLNLFTERNSDGTGYLVLRGKDIFDRYKRRITDADIRAICLYLKEEPKRITRLDLSYNNITDVGFFKLLKEILVKGRSSVINLNIMNNNLTEASVLNLAKYAQFLKLKYLRLNGNDFGVNGAEYFADFLKKNDTLQYCDIGETNLTLTGVTHIVAALRCDNEGNDTLKVLDLSRIIPLFNRYSYETKWLAYHIEFLIERNSTIIELHLQKNQFIGHDVEYFVRGLRRNDTLLYLDLGYNRIGEYGAQLLGKYLAEKPPLIFLNVAGNGIKDTGARALSFGLPYSKIRALDVGYNKITDDGILDLLNTLKKYYFMRFLNIWGNTITHVSCVVIERMLMSGALFQHTIDVKVYEVDNVLHAAYYPNPANRNKHLYYDELDYGCAQPIYHIKRNVIPEKKNVKVDCKQRHRLDKTDKNNF
ncbi:leucine-rich repeat-containing protein 34-like [Maniola jurtina]|uniref:leucine-rich repeat-containing protein 34-like n=1 Tax=Maniola jurtina TaxID=191418 RepID=UPI001E68814C|nr:leucine-rich repeat-containing protein 34-like [Maniola jurtina]